ncbi:hypothetical protein ACC677_36940, partial [Rhizobium ruizarguesonis]
ELVTGDPFWAVLAGGAGAYSFYMLFWTFNPQPPAIEPPVQPDAEDKFDHGPAEANGNDGN